MELFATSTGNRVHLKDDNLKRTVEPNVMLNYKKRAHLFLSLTDFEWSF